TPDTPLAPMRGRTTQNLVSSRVKGSACWSSSTVATTRVWSSLRLIAVTWPMTTFLYFTCVLLASRPSAVSKLTVICGPEESQFCTSMEKPTRAAAMGTSQTSEMRTGLCLISGVPARESGRLGLSDIVFLCIPDQSRIEAHRRQHCQHHHQA